MTKKFNIAGPMKSERHYTISSLERWVTEDILELIDDQKYFVLHAPRQTGKTSCLLAMRDYLNERDDYLCVYVNFESGQTARNDLARGIKTVTQELHESVLMTIQEPLIDPQEIFQQIEPDKILNTYLKKLSAAIDKPLVLFIDEVDALVGDTLISVLRQLRSGYPGRPEHFPQSVVLCGVRDIKDYRIHRSDGEIITGGSCFNIKAKSLTLGNFSECDVRSLYAQHTEETGQHFDESVFPFVMRLTGGQPWLVNALANEAVWEMRENRDPAVVITPKIIEEAKERLILARTTHLDQLTDKLKEPRVRRIIEPMLLGNDFDPMTDDIEYCVDLGLIRKSDCGFIISNEIYREVMPRELTNITEEKFLSKFTPEWVKPDGTIDIDKLMTLFQQFWRENSDIWATDIAGYKEAAPHLVFMAFLQRVANGNGSIFREYGLGRKRVDLMLKWNAPDREQRFVFELKVRGIRENTDESLAKLKDTGIAQTAEYAETCDAESANLIIFDRRPDIPWDDRIFIETAECDSRSIIIWGL